jgi:hypothetical protein
MIYPLISNDHLPTSNPHGFIPWYWKNSSWKIPYQETVNYIEEKFKEGVIPIGTILYHGSLESDLNFNALKKDRITFFGLDFIISIWYTLELQRSYRNLKEGTLYEFKVIEPIPVHIIRELYDHPKSISICTKQKMACIHPQIAYHGSTEAPSPYDLCIEITMNMKHFSKYIQLIKKHTIDTKQLYDNRYELFSKFDPKESIVETKKIGGKILQKTRKYRKKHL